MPKPKQSLKSASRAQNADNMEWNNSVGSGMGSDSAAAKRTARSRVRVGDTETRRRESPADYYRRQNAQ